MRTFRPYRDFRAFADGACLTAAASRRLYFDLEARRLQRVPASLSDTCTEETDTAVDFALYTWNRRPPARRRRRLLTALPDTAHEDAQ